MIITAASYVRTLYCSCNLWKIALNEKTYQSILTINNYRFNHVITHINSNIPNYHLMGK